MFPRIAKLLSPREQPSAPTDRGALGAHAKRLIDDPVLQLCWDRIERDLMGSITNSAVGEQEVREAAYRLVWAARQVKAQLRAMLNDAKLLEAEQKAKEKREQFEARRRERSLLGQ